MEVLSSLVGSLVLLLMLCGSGLSAGDGTDNCKLLDGSASERAALNRLKPLLYRNFSVAVKNATESYTYTFQLCGNADGAEGAGIIQNDDLKKKRTIIGRYNSTKVYGGSDWVMLIYEHGDNYTSHCGKVKRKANIMISCDRKIALGNLEAVEEDREGTDCFYLFELDTSAVCPVLESKLSAGSIMLIIGVCFVAVYLIGGFLYQRLVVGAKGMEQMPNYSFWVDVGNLTADGCDFVCRSRSREESNPYIGVSTEPVDEQPEERDDHLLPM